MANSPSFNSRVTTISVSSSRSSTLNSGAPSPHASSDMMMMMIVKWSFLSSTGFRWRSTAATLQLTNSGRNHRKFLGKPTLRRRQRQSTRHLMTLVATSKRPRQIVNTHCHLVSSYAKPNFTFCRSAFSYLFDA